MSQICAHIQKTYNLIIRKIFYNDNNNNIFYLHSLFNLGAPLFIHNHIFMRWTTFGRSDVVSRGRCKGLRTLSKVSKTWGFCSISKNDSRRGTFEEDLHRCIFRRRCSTRDMFIRPVRTLGGPGADFLRGVAFWSIRSSVLLRWFCVTGAAIRMTWHHFFVAGALL